MGTIHLHLNYNSKIKNRLINNQNELYVKRKVACDSPTSIQNGYKMCHWTSIRSSLPKGGLLDAINNGLGFCPAEGSFIEYFQSGKSKSMVVIANYPGFRKGKCSIFRILEVRPVKSSAIKNFLSLLLNFTVNGLISCYINQVGRYIYMSRAILKDKANYFLSADNEGEL